MAVIMTLEFPATVEQYDAVNEKLDGENNPIEGMILHTGVVSGDGTMKIFDVWESAEAFQKFAQERLGPAVAEVMGGDGQQPQPEFLEVHDLLKQ